MNKKKEIDTNRMGFENQVDRFSTKKIVQLFKVNKVLKIFKWSQKRSAVYLIA